MKEQLIKELMKNWIKCNPKTSRNAKWYELDKKDYESHIRKLPIEEFQRIANNLKVLNSPAFDKAIEREVNKLDKAGMYAINNMRATNALD